MRATGLILLTSVDPNGTGAGNGHEILVRVAGVSPPATAGHQSRRGRPGHGKGRASKRRRIRLRRVAALSALVLVIAVIAVAGVSAARAREHASRSRARKSPPATARVHPAVTASSPAASPRAAVTTPQRALAAALAPILAHRTGHVAVGVIDRTTGVRAFYHAAELFHTASIVKADVLAVLLLRHQQSGTDLSADEDELAEQMIEDSDNDAASDLWGDDGGAYGMAEANETLGLAHTTPGADYYWGLTTTSVSDQLTLLDDLASPHSPLEAASRSFELHLMKNVTADQAWGVSAAATPGTPCAVKNGWLPDPQLWVINSIGVIEHDHQQLLVAALSDDQPSEAVGIAQIEAVARAAVDSVTGTS